MPNDQLFIDTLAQIEREPSSWYQAEWAVRSNECGTAFCFAGWAVQLAGHEVLWDSGVVASMTTNHVWIERVALDELGITKDQGIQLFAARNQLGTLYEIAAEILSIEESVLRDKVKDALDAE